MQMNRYRLDEVLLSGKLYSSFEETIFDRKLEDDLGMTELKDGLCDWNHGFGGELFTGHIGEGEIGGTPLHSAGLGNFFRQLAGVRNWTLISPEYSYLVRPVHGFLYSNAFGIYNAWKPKKFKAHMEHIPKQHVTLHPGDVLYIPPWWWHEIQIESGFNAGVSTRTLVDIHKWTRLPIARFLPGINPYWSLGGMAMDVVHLFPLFRLFSINERPPHGLIQTTQTQEASGVVKRLLRENLNLEE